MNTQQQSRHEQVRQTRRRRLRSVRPSAVHSVSASAERPVMFHRVLIGPLAHMVNTRVAYRETLENTLKRYY